MRIRTLPVLCMLTLTNAGAEGDGLSDDTKAIRDAAAIPADSKRWSSAAVRAGT